MQCWQLHRKFNLAYEAIAEISQAAVVLLQAEARQQQVAVSNSTALATKTVKP
jgi:hypothetical protein